MAKKIYPQKKGFSPFRELVGVKFTVVENGFSRCSLKVARKHLSPNGTVHGGTISTMADSGMGAALWSCIRENEACATIENHIFYFKPVRSGILECDSKVISYREGIAVLESEIRKGNQSVAKAAATWSVFKV